MSSAPLKQSSAPPPVEELDDEDEDEDELDDADAEDDAEELDPLVDPDEDATDDVALAVDVLEALEAAPPSDDVPLEPSTPSRASVHAPATSTIADPQAKNPPNFIPAIIAP